MPLEANSVQIKINVVDMNSGAAIAGVEQNLTTLGAAGARSGAQVEAGMKQASAGMLSAVERTRLATEEFGVRLPRAMITLISQSKAAQAVFNSLGTAMIGLASIQIGVMIGEAAFREISKYWEKWVELKEVIADTGSVIKAFGQDAASAIERQTSAMERYISVTRGAQAADRFRLSNLQSKPIDLSKIYGSKEYQGLPDAVKGQFENLTGESIAPKDLDATIGKVEKYQASLKATLAQTVAPHYGMAMGPIQLGNIPDDYRGPDPRKLEMGIKTGESLLDDLKKQREAYSTEVMALQADIDHAGKEKSGNAGGRGGAGSEKSQAAELARIHEEALESRLRGSALYDAQEAKAIQDLRDRGIASAQAVEDIHAIFHGKEMARLAEENRAVAKMREETQLSGLTGTARVKQEGQNRVNDVYASTNLNPGARLAEINEINKQTSQQVAEEEKKENAEKLRSATELGAKQQRATMETQRIEEQAGVRFLSAERQKTAAISAELEARKAKYLEELNAQEISQDDYNRRVIAAQKNANGEMVEASREAHDKMAHQFESVFREMNDPRKMLEDLGSKFSSNFAATMFQRAQQHFSGAPGATASAEKGPWAFAHNLFGGGSKTPGAETAHLHAGAGTSGAHSVAQASFSVAQATIQVGGANFAGGAPGGSAPSGSAGWSGTPTGTTLAAPGSSGGTGGFGGGGTGGSAPSGSAGWSGTPTGTTLAAPGSSGATGGFSGGRIAREADAGGTGSGWTGESTGGFSGSAAPDEGGFFGGGPSSFGGAPSATVGGAGAGSPPSTFSRGISTAGSAAGASGNSTIAAVGSAGKQTYADYKQLKGYGVFGGGGGGSSSTSSSSGAPPLETEDQQIPGQFDSSGSFQSSASGLKSSMGDQSQGDRAMGAAHGAIGLFSAYEGSGGLGGAAKGAMSGAELGMEVGGPMGAAIGAVAGAIIGAIGIGGGKAARAYDLKTVRPRLTIDRLSFQQGSMDYLAAYSDMESLQSEAFKATSAMGPRGRAYRDEYITPEIKKAEAALTAEQKAGRSMYSAQAASYAVGTDYVPATGWNLNHEGERIIPSDQNKEITRALTGGSGTRQAQSTSRGDIHLHVHAIDPKGVAGFLDKYKNDIRAAVNDSYGENSGGGL